MSGLTPKWKRIKARLADENPSALCADGFDRALVGYSQGCGRPALAVYDVDLCINVLIDQGMGPEEAEEFFWFNTAGGWLGENTPIFVQSGDNIFPD